MDITRATEVNQEVRETVKDMFEYHSCNEDQIGRSAIVRNALMEAVRCVIAVVPPSTDRSACIRKLREASMDANSAITHKGKY